MKKEGDICWLLIVADVWIFLKYPFSTTFWVCLVTGIILLIFAVGKIRKITTMMKTLLSISNMAKAIQSQTWATERHSLVTKFTYEHGTQGSLASHVFQSIGYALGFETNNIQE